MRTTNNSQKTIASALEDLGVDLGLFPKNEVRNAGLPESMMTAPGLQARIRPEFDLPLVTATGPQAEVSVVPSQVKFSELKLGPRFSGEPNGPSTPDWSVFCRFRFTAFSPVLRHSHHPTKVGYGNGVVFGIRPAVLRSPDSAFSCASQEGLDRVLAEDPRFAWGTRI